MTTRFVKVNVSSRVVYAANLFFLCFLFTFCNSHHGNQKEEISINSHESSLPKDSVLNSIQSNASPNQIATTPNSVILTGLTDHRLVTVYKSKIIGHRLSEKYSSFENDGTESLKVEHFMPGFDVLYGYYLLNIAHYDLKTEKLNFLFDHPALIKTVYFPSFKQDSLNKKPINRNFYLISVYDEDTNKDTLINRKDLRRFYLFDADTHIKTQLIPSDYSVERSQYDSQNDVIYIFARCDVNKNGSGDPNEPVHIFWMSLKDPQPAKRLY